MSKLEEYAGCDGLLNINIQYHIGLTPITKLVIWMDWKASLERINRKLSAIK